jgi:hypothetical protein
MIRNFKKGFAGDYRVKLMPGKLQTLCEVEWPLFGISWPLKGTLVRIQVPDLHGGYWCRTSSYYHPCGPLLC